MIELLISHLDVLISFITGGGLMTLFTIGANSRKVNAEAKEKEINNWILQIERYENRLQERDSKVDSLYVELRKEQEKVLSLVEELNKAELNIEILNIQKCDKRGCIDRTPPSAY